MSSRPVAALTADGTNTGHFERTDWLLLAATALIWGSSFLWIDIGLDTFHPGAIALIRTMLGAGVLSLSATARRPIDRSSWPAIGVVAVAGNAAPALLFPFAQQRVESSVAGMMNSASPVLVLLIAIVMTRRGPPRLQVIGLGVGLVGAVMMALPNVIGADAQPLGMLLVGTAVLGYAIANNFLPPLQQRYGGPAVILRALALSAVLLSPYGIWGLTQSDTSGTDSQVITSVLALLILGVLGTGIARALFATLVGRVGAPRSSMVGYFVPITAIVLGVLVRDESVGVVELLGTGLVVIGARIISRGARTRPKQVTQGRPARPTSTGIV